jgi:hypothetical protein
MMDVGAHDRICVGYNKRNHPPLRAAETRETAAKEQERARDKSSKEDIK